MVHDTSEAYQCFDHIRILLPAWLDNSKRLNLGKIELSDVGNEPNRCPK